MVVQDARVLSLPSEVLVGSIRQGSVATFLIRYAREIITLDTQEQLLQSLTNVSASSEATLSRVPGLMLLQDFITKEVGHSCAVFLTITHPRRRRGPWCRL